MTAISFACLCSLRTTTAAAAAEGDRPQQRQLEDEWTGEWNGEWTAGDDAVYECGDDCNDDDQKSNSGMWLDNDIDALGLSPDQIISYVSIGILVFMTLLCCMCYPEIIVVAYGKICGCCGGGGGGGAGGKGVSGNGDGEEEAVVQGDYVGGRQEREDKDRKKKKRRKSKTRSSSRSKPSRNVELV